jgi:hypothetical protein
VISSRAFNVIGFFWFFGWGFLLLKFPHQCYRAFAWGREPKPSNLKMAKVVGYMGLGGGTLLLMEMVFGVSK